MCEQKWGVKVNTQKRKRQKRDPTTGCPGEQSGAEQRSIQRAPHPTKHRGAFLQPHSQAVSLSKVPPPANKKVNPKEKGSRLSHNTVKKSPTYHATPQDGGIVQILRFLK